MNLVKTAITRRVKEWLALYPTGRLNRTQEWLTKHRIAGDDSLQKELEYLRLIRSAIRQQPELAPDPQIIKQINATIRNERQETYSNKRQTVAWVTLLLAVLLGLLFLWRAYPPGIVLSWSSQGGAPELFRVYRAEQNTSTLAKETFQLLEEVPVDSSVVSYNFTDWVPALNKDYIYRVEVVDYSGQVAADQSIVAEGIDSLPGQMVLLVGALLIAGIAIQLVIAARRRPVFGYSVNTFA